MKNASQQYLESSRPDASTLDAIAFCLERLFADSHNNTTDIVCHNLTFEELIGALLLARDLAEDDI